MTPSSLTTLLALLGFAWLAFLTLILLRLSSHYQALTKNTDKKDLMAILNQLLADMKTNRSSINTLKDQLSHEITANKAHFQRLGFKRFNPFAHTGGDQSFVLCLLDENDNGIVISSLHSRENTRIYAKRVQDGKAPDQILSKEEKEAISLALK